MDASLAVIIKELRRIRLRSQLHLGAVRNRCALVWRQAWRGRARMFELDEQVFDISIHADAASSARIVPLDVNSSKLVPQHVELDSMIFLEKI